MIYRRTQEIQNDDTQSFQARQLANEMAGYARDAMNTAHLNFQTQYNPSYQYQPQSHNTGFPENQYNTPSPYYPVFDPNYGASSSMPDYTQ